MVLEQNPSEGMLGAQTEPWWGAKIEAELNPGEKMVGTKTEPLFKPKIGSVIPPKRKSVKRMMFDYLFQSIASLFRSHPPRSSASGAPPFKKEAILPHP
ncbi:hypothetical protein L1049_027251 [Liquidambar formosana]|uniref:Uncharacterized protein n=1 Tax=Liquidambar formosana TaxID=63359 RepID=A0AAP0R3Y1_LIQFO